MHDGYKALFIVGDFTMISTLLADSPISISLNRMLIVVIFQQDEL